MKIISKVIALFGIISLLCIDLFTVIQVSKFYSKLSFEYNLIITLVIIGTGILLNCIFIIYNYIDRK
jgi:hypothetical protein